jgi:membrane protein implicated in regulation of membrane protease activity
MTKFTFQGTGQTVGGSSGAGAALLIIGAVILLGSGAAAAIAAAVVVAIIVLAVVVVLSAAGLIAYLIWRARRDVAPSRRGIVPAPVVHQLAAPERPAIPQHLHLHFDGADPAAVAEILRRHQAE